MFVFYGVNAFIEFIWENEKEDEREKFFLSLNIDTKTLLISLNESNLINRTGRFSRYQMLFVFVSPLKHNYFSIYLPLV